MQKSLAFATFFAAVAWASPASAAYPAPDMAPPTLWAPATVTLVVGRQIPVQADPTEFPWLSGVLATFSWTASDPSGICGYDVEQVYAGQPSELVLERTMITSYTGFAENYDGSLGGGSSSRTAWRITAYDCAGNRSQRIVSNVVGFHDSDGQRWGYARPSTLEFAGAWSVRSYSGFLGGTTRSSTAEGSAASFTSTFDAGDRVALVTSLGPTRGRARILVDGVPRATIDTYRDRPMHRVVSWQGWMPAGTHTVTIVNLGTSGHPRVDVDALLTT